MRVPALAQDPAAVPPVPTIVTTGEAIIRRAPDQAFVTVAVETRAKNAAGGPAAERRSHDGRAAARRRRRPSARTPSGPPATPSSRSSTLRMADAMPRGYLARNGLESARRRRRTHRRRARRAGQAGATIYHRRAFRSEGSSGRRTRGAAPRGGRRARPRRGHRGRCRPHGRPGAPDRRFAAVRRCRRCWPTIAMLQRCGRCGAGRRRSSRGTIEIRAQVDARRSRSSDRTRTPRLDAAMPPASLTAEDYARARRVLMRRDPVLGARSRRSARA